MEENEIKYCVYCKEPIAEGNPYMTEPRGGYIVYYHLHCFRLLHSNTLGKSFFDIDED